jgi:hypothetical protein
MDKLKNIPIEQINKYIKNDDLHILTTIINAVKSESKLACLNDFDQKKNIVYNQELKLNQENKDNKLVIITKENYTDILSEDEIKYLTYFTNLLKVTNVKPHITVADLFEPIIYEYFEIFMKNKNYNMISANVIILCVLIYKYREYGNNKIHLTNLNITSMCYTYLNRYKTKEEFVALINIIKIFTCNIGLDIVNNNDKIQKETNILNNAIKLHLNNETVTIQNIWNFISYKYTYCKHIKISYPGNEFYFTTPRIDFFTTDIINILFITSYYLSFICAILLTIYITDLNNNCLIITYSIYSTFFIYVFFILNNLYHNYNKTYLQKMVKLL